MKLIMESWRKFNEEEQEEERSELDKIKEIFMNNGAQAVELGEMLLPDAKEIGMMKRAVRVVREFLGLFEKPASNFDQRLRARDTFYYDMDQTLKSIISSHRLGALARSPGKAMYIYQTLGGVYLMMDKDFGGNTISLEDRLPDIEAAAEWAGVPAPQIPEGWSSE